MQDSSRGVICLGNAEAWRLPRSSKPPLQRRRIDHSGSPLSRIFQTKIRRTRLVLPQRYVFSRSNVTAKVSRKTDERDGQAELADGEIPAA